MPVGKGTTRRGVSTKRRGDGHCGVVARRPHRRWTRGGSRRPTPRRSGRRPRVTPVSHRRDGPRRSGGGAARRRPRTPTYRPGAGRPRRGSGPSGRPLCDRPSGGHRPARAHGRHRRARPPCRRAHAGRTHPRPLRPGGGRHPLRPLLHRGSPPLWAGSARRWRRHAGRRDRRRDRLPARSPDARRGHPPRRRRDGGAPPRGSRARRSGPSLRSLSRHGGALRPDWWAGRDGDERDDVTDLGPRSGERASRQLDRPAGSPRPWGTNAPRR